MHQTFHKVYEEFENTKAVIRIRKSKKVRQRNDRKKQDKGTNNDHTNPTKHWKSTKSLLH
jgi:hypothetical protein